MILVTTVGRCFCVARSVTEDDVPAQGNDAGDPESGQAAG